MVPKGKGEYEKVPLKGFIEFKDVNFGYSPEKKVLNKINPVSYTHLDVYKRQLYIR